jgi:hypothetical protein
VSFSYARDDFIQPSPFDVSAGEAAVVALGDNNLPAFMFLAQNIGSHASRWA